MEDIRSALGSTDPSIAEAAAMQVAQSAVVDPSLAVPLVRAVSSKHEGIREWSTAALENLDAPQPSDIEALTEFIRLALTDSDCSDSAYWALTLIARLGGEGESAIDIVTKAADSASSSVQERAVWCLGRMGSSAGAAIPLLERLAKDDSPRIARLASRAISQIAD